ncbi:MAG: tRNA uracil 4-sulfurtransferase ThiI [Candidatus Thorarchaeota archaeon]
MILSIEYSAVLVRYGEIGIKSRQTRHRLVNMLVRHLRSALREQGISFEQIRTEFGRIFIETEEADKAANASAGVFGVVSTSPVVVVNTDLDLILDVGLEVAKSVIDEDQSFAIDAHRVGEHDFTSMDIKIQLGDLVLQSFGDDSVSVDLDNPENLIYVEVRPDTAYIFTSTIEGLGGMPTGTQGKAICTISGGLDSPIAAYKVMRRGCIPVFLYLDNAGYSNSTCREAAIEQAKILSKYIYDYEVKMYIVQRERDLEQIVEKVPERMICVYCKRNMLRIAQMIGFEENADVIVTGDILGEQASQTSRNIRAIDSAICELPVLRPCIGEDKETIQELSRQLGTYEPAARAQTCCTLPPQYPIIKPHIDSIEEFDSTLDFTILKDEVRDSKVLNLRSP